MLDPHEVIRRRSGPADQPLYIICKGGTRGAKAQQKFVEAGFDNVINVEGGTEAWVAAGLYGDDRPFAKPKHIKAPP